MLRKLRWKITLILMLLFAAALTVVLAIQTYSALRQYSDETDSALQAVLQERGSWQLGPGTGQNGEDLYAAIPTVCVTLDSNRLVAYVIRYSADIEESVLLDAINQVLSRGQSSGELSRLNLRYQTQSSGLELRIAFADLTWAHAAQRRQVVTAILIWTAAMLGFFAVSLFLSKWLVRPVERSWQQQQQFIADASHELKTPLTVLLADADILLAHQSDTIESQRKWVEYIQAEGRRMKALVEDMLFLARSDYASRQEQPKTQVALTDLCWNCLLSFEPVAFELGAELQSDLAPQVSVLGNEKDLRRLVTILLDNACKYCGKGGAVSLTLTAGEKITLAVHNTGDPIPAEEQAHLFERFYRADTARARQSGGYGLGLAIAASISENHRGRITVRSTAEDGTTFTVTLPKG